MFTSVCWWSSTCTLSCDLAYVCMCMSCDLAYVCMCMSYDLAYVCMCMSCNANVHSCRFRHTLLKCTLVHSIWYVTHIVTLYKCIIIRMLSRIKCNFKSIYTFQVFSFNFIIGCWLTWIQLIFEHNLKSNFFAGFSFKPNMPNSIYKCSNK